MITYKEKIDSRDSIHPVVEVFLDGKRVGRIKQSGEYFQYFPKGQSRGGESFSTLTACKQSLEND